MVKNCVDTTFLADFENDENYKFAYNFVTNAAIDAGALPFDDIQTESSPRRHGGFTSKDLGYETVLKCCLLS